MPGSARTALAVALVAAAVASCSTAATTTTVPPPPTSTVPSPGSDPLRDGPFADELRRISAAVGIPEDELLREWHVLVRLEVPLPWAVAREAPAPVIPSEAEQLVAYAERDDGYAYYVFGSPGDDLAVRLAADSVLPADERLVVLGYSLPAADFAAVEDALAASGLVAGWEMLGTAASTVPKPTDELYTAEVVAGFAEYYAGLGMGG